MAIQLLVGEWEGEMGGKPLQVVISEISADNTVSGYNVLGSNKRPVEGTCTVATIDQYCAIAYDVKLNEPSDDEWDGVFSIRFTGWFVQEEGEDGLECLEEEGLESFEGFGNWKSNNGKLEREFDLLPKY
ncbi:MAG: hypothetical protein QF371_00055 [Flavobacteriales bacterium]|nr:hypothetical protein [Flavobacteriales bacterium]